MLPNKTIACQSTLIVRIWLYPPPLSRMNKRLFYPTRRPYIIQLFCITIFSVHDRLDEGSMADKNC